MLAPTGIYIIRISGSSRALLQIFDRLLSMPVGHFLICIYPLYFAHLLLQNPGRLKLLAEDSTRHAPLR